ncbi:MAG: hypothetical protein P1Q69_15860 [Candidatus Thorarchaeota archaeon]|nr:hypothetical protein [Candidatus Thorarchaeota archaeon]
MGTHKLIEEHVDIMEDARKRLDSIEFPFANLLQNSPQFRDYFMRISKAMMAISELSNDEWSPDLINRVERIVSNSADELEKMLKMINRR